MDRAAIVPDALREFCPSRVVAADGVARCRPDDTFTANGEGDRGSPSKLAALSSLFIAVVLFDKQRPSYAHFLRESWLSSEPLYSVLDFRCLCAPPGRRSILSTFRISSSEIDEDERLNYNDPVKFSSSRISACNNL